MNLRRPSTSPSATVSHRVAVVILAGGLGTRLRSAVPDRPKVLAPVGGRPFLAWWLETLELDGWREVVLCTGYQAEKVRACFGDRWGQLRIRYSVESQPLGTGGALQLASAEVSADRLLVLNGDSYCATPLHLFAEHQIETGWPTSLVVTRVPDTRRFGRVQFDDGGRVQALEEKDPTPGTGWVNAGIYLVERSRVAAMPAGQPASIERDFVPRWIAAGMGAFAVDDPFIDIGTPESYAQAEAFLGAQEATAVEAATRP